MSTIETVVRSINRDLMPQFEERLRAVFAEQDRERLIDQVVRLTLDAHSLEEIDRRVVVQAKARARAERLARVQHQGLDRRALEALLTRAKDVLFALLFGDESTNTHLDRVQHEPLTMALQGRCP